MTLDPVTLAVIQNVLRQVASEMDLVHEKTSFSPVISEGFDRSNGIYDRTTGEVIAQGELGLPIFVGVMQFTTQAVIESRRDLEPGDVILVNDPYLGGTHLMDVKMVRPFYYCGRLWCYLSNTGHWPDTGGMVPGGFSATATEIVQEGLRLPPVKLVRRGEICQDIIDIVLNNIRVADERIGDIGLGHQQRLPPPRLSGRCGFGEGTFAKARGNGKDAPFPDLPTLAPERVGSIHSRPFVGQSVE